MKYKSFVITIKDLQKSEDAASRCIVSGIKQGLVIEKFYGYTPENDPIQILIENKMPVDGFKEQYSYLESCVSAFLSHFALWQKCVEDNCQYIIFEHDAVLTNDIDYYVPFDKCINIGAPSYGKFNTPNFLGVGPLTSKRYFPGAHAYRLKPDGARELIKEAKKYPMPTDIFLNLDRFPWLQEQYPWPAKAVDSFTTIQRERGCLAKHNWNDGYEIIQ